MENQKIDLPRDLVIPTKLALSKEIEDEYKFLYMYISYRASTRGYIWYQNDTLANHLGKSLASIKRGLKALKEAKWIHIENRVKKGKLYHQDMRRVIWIYSDYLVALDKGGYGVARPLAFSTWKKRFIGALLDSSKIPLVLYFFPTVEKMGEMKINYDPQTKKLYAYVLNGANKWETRKLDRSEAEEAYKELYDFYSSQHTDEESQNAADDSKQFKKIDNFNAFQKFIREEYTDKTIAIINDKEIIINALGLLMVIEDKEVKQLDTDLAIQTWQWLFVNQDEIIRS
ncbi:helix-turn-helix domain-containing protein [Sulfurimonas sp. SWIR-19]|uniref:helix-turn-helix domain-containing protein n=1 Tax=Sulfurimonas sp. SWIR-19 TaxID=2878390 RepID=UPI001CF5AC0E|nr:helix-turn-helix domain-containing protein [Sulfurimonas sp. SWIR-19]UCM99206.1 helix-turn-helix domain-containing protein [Sulfurimonas sp. SWIR-19]